jgi:hypothetical protein
MGREAADSFGLMGAALYQSQALGLVDAAQAALDNHGD